MSLKCTSAQTNKTKASVRPQRQPYVSELSWGETGRCRQISARSCLDRLKGERPRPCNTASVVPPAAGAKNSSIQKVMRVRRRLSHSRNNPAKFTRGSDVFKLKALPLMGSAVHYSMRGVGAFCQCVGFVPIGGGALGSRLQRWRCSLSFRADTSTSKSCKRLRHRERGGVPGAVVPAKSRSASGERGGRLLLDLRDHPSRLVVILAGCAALAGAVRVPNNRAFRLFHFHFCLAATCGISIARSSPRLIPGRC